MTLKIRFSMVGAKDRVRDSRQPVHSWNERYRTDGLGACANCSAIATPIEGGSAMADAAAVQNLMNPRRLMPCRRNISPTVTCASPCGIVYSASGHEEQSGARAAHGAGALPWQFPRL